MSLRVWLPLIENTNNQGISSLNTFSYNTLTQQTDGKLGKCYSGQGIYHLENDFLSNEWSLCAWVKSAGWSQYNDIILCKNTSTSDNCQFYFSIINGATLNFAVNAGSGGLTFNYTFATNTWYHVAATYDGSEYALYINGEQKKKQAVSTAAKTGMNNLGINCRSANEAGTSQTGDSGKKLNDVRIYDHCLSAAEVREIAQGLVLHYKLDNNSRGGRNLIRIGTGSFHNTNELTTLTWSGWDSYNSLALTDMDWNNRYGQQITYSCYVENVEQTAGTGSGIMLHVRYTDGTYQQFGGGKNGTSGSYLAQGESGWLKLTVTIPDASARSTPTTISYIQVSVRHNSSSGASTIRYKCPQAELGNQQTTWYWAPEDTGENNNIIEDSSGYNHNLTLTGNLLCDNTTPRYSTSMAFDGTTVATAASTGADIRTISCWVKTTKNKSTSQIFVADSGSNMCVSFYNGTIIGVFGTTRSTGSKCTLGDSYKENDWNHIVVIKTSDDGQRDIWCNGVQLTPAANDYWSAATGLWLGARNASVVNPLYGALSDVRFYVTPLLDTDIKQLYNVGMKVDKNQNIHNFELIEKNYNIFSATPWCNGFNTHTPATSPFINFNSNGEPQFTTNNSSAGTDYLEITPGIYEYDYTISVNTGNQFYIGFERYDADKTSRSNNACVYTYSTKPSADVVKQRYKGTVNLSTDGTNQLKYIALRILNGWSGTTNGVTGQATIHNFSLRLQSAAVNPKVTKTGQLISDEFKEYSSARFYKDHIIEANQFIER